MMEKYIKALSRTGGQPTQVVPADPITSDIFEGIPGLQFLESFGKY